MMQALIKPTFFIIILLNTLFAQESMLFHNIDSWHSSVDSLQVNILCPQLSPQKNLRINTSFYSDFYLNENRRYLVGFALSHKKWSWYSHYLFSGQNIWNFHELINGIKYRLSPHFAIQIGLQEQHVKLLEPHIPYQHQFSSFISFSAKIKHLYFSAGILGVEQLGSQEKLSGLYIQLEYPLQNSNILIHFKTNTSSSQLYLNYLFKLNQKIQSSTKVNLLQLQFQQEINWLISNEMSISFGYLYQHKVQSGLTLSFNFQMDN